MMIPRLLAAALLLVQPVASFAGAFEELEEAARPRRAPVLAFGVHPHGIVPKDRLDPQPSVSAPRKSRFEKRVGKIYRHSDCTGFLSCFGAGLISPARTPVRMALAGADYGGEQYGVPGVIGGGIGGALAGLVMWPVTVVSGIAKGFYKLFRGELV